MAESKTTEVEPHDVDWGRMKALSKRAIDKFPDIQALQDMLDDALDRCIGIQTQLEYSNRDDAWREAAITALIFNKIEKKNLQARLTELKKDKA
jgi:hypothetical protein